MMLGPPTNCVTPQGVTQRQRHAHRYREEMDVTAASHSQQQPQQLYYQNPMTPSPFQYPGMLFTFHMFVVQWFSTFFSCQYSILLKIYVKPTKILFKNTKKQSYKATNCYQNLLISLLVVHRLRNTVSKLIEEFLAVFNHIPLQTIIFLY
jgi:hypothetical protein